MIRIGSVFLALALASPAIAAPDGKPATIQMVGRWREQDPVHPRPNAEPWTPADVAGFLALNPNARMDLGVYDAYPVGNMQWRRMGGYVREARGIADAQGIPTDRRLCVTERPDVVYKSVANLKNCSLSAGGGGCDWEGGMDGRLGEQETVVKVAGSASSGEGSMLADASARWTPGQWQHRLLVLRPNKPGEERRRIISSHERGFVVDEPWISPPRPGDLYEVRGSFDATWIRRVPATTHAATVRRFWTERRDVCRPLERCNRPAEPLDPFDPANRRSWSDSMNRQAYEELREGGRVPALYGSVRDQGEAPHFEDPFFRVSALVADVTNREYRSWRLRYLLYKLEEHGFEPGDPVCLTIAYKPGWHTYHGSDHESNTDACSVPGAHQWSGPAHVCDPGRKVDGLFHPTTYGPKEFEAGMNAYFRELFAILEANGYGNADVLTTEGPRYTKKLWAILADDVRRHPKLIGERAGWMRPPLAALDRAGLRGLSTSRPSTPPKPLPPAERPGDARPRGTGREPSSPPPASSAPQPSPSALPPSSSALGAPNARSAESSTWSLRSAPTSNRGSGESGRKVSVSGSGARGAVGSRTGATAVRSEESRECWKVDPSTASSDNSSEHESGRGDAHRGERWIPCDEDPEAHLADGERSRPPGHPKD